MKWAKKKQPAIRRKKRSFRMELPSLVSQDAMLQMGPVLVATWGFFLVAILMGANVPSWLYLLLGLGYMMAGVFGLRPQALPVLASIVGGQLALALVGDLSVAQSVISGFVLVSAATLVPITARVQVLRSATNQRRELQGQMSARVRVGERLADGITPSPVSSALQPVSTAEGISCNLLLMSKKALHARTAMFCWYDDNNDRLVPVDAISDTPELLSYEPIVLSKTRLAAIKRSRTHVALRYSPRMPQNVPMYNRPVTISGFLAVPVFLRSSLAGAFLFDKQTDDPFFLPDNVIVKKLATVVEETLANERRLKSAIVMSSQMRALNDLAREMGTARAFEQVYEIIMRQALAFAPFQTAILAHRVSPESSDFEIVGVTRKDLMGLMEQKFQLKGSLCGLAANAGGPLPPKYIFEPRMPQPFGASVGVELDVGEECLLLPLLTNEDAVGFLLFVDSQRRPDREELVPLQLLAEFSASVLKNTEANNALERMATRDALTGIPNQRAFRSRLAEAIDRSDRSKKPLSILFVDVDHFKGVNDNFGHAIGDVVLKQIATTLNDAVRKVDFAARYGGEEFVAILEECDTQGATLLGERVRQRVADHRFDDLDGKGVTISVGIATYPNDTDDSQALLALADAALYKAKNAGRNNCQVA